MYNDVAKLDVVCYGDIFKNENLITSDSYLVAVVGEYKYKIAKENGKYVLHNVTHFNFNVDIVHKLVVEHPYEIWFVGEFRYNKFGGFDKTQFQNLYTFDFSKLDEFISNKIDVKFQIDFVEFGIYNFMTNLLRDKLSKYDEQQVIYDTTKKETISVSLFLNQYEIKIPVQFQYKEHFTRKFVLKVTDDVKFMNGPRLISNLTIPEEVFQTMKFYKLKLSSQLSRETVYRRMKKFYGE